ncbi:Very-long-chain enoyl-CoA reductase [Recurvomyces mirabilis]|uniref:very-long-chain enoyl-CoA reductase n=1 Tax=Recurvomyces mirabilis TaxID=574656 RepID=A0AAE0WNR4_9PEZI|nr:Very-long-chain enoyl-CoA reductase [Recurvomyces mirabilis]KAK5158366.1 3-oxo-5a-steroid 4- dehydrogenase [Recurvomyces mirabilis]
MASKPIALTVEPRGKRIPKLPKETSIYLQGSASDLYDRIARDANFSVHRLRITNKNDGKPIANDKKTSVSSVGLENGSVIQVKDLGPQIAWRTVFIIEYLGPLLIHPVLLLLRPYIYRNPNLLTAYPPPSTLQLLTCWTITLHFLKRELETLFVHRFSNATMPVQNIFKNSFHYWILAGVLIAAVVYSPISATAATNTNPLLTYIGLALYVLGELGNLNTHLVLRSLRSPGGAERGVPKGLGFDWVTCPNYLFETLAWAGILVISRSWSTGIFVAVATAQMAVWARKKESRYRKELGGTYERKRFSMIPGVW